jgi:hypothetical protein
MSHIDVDFDDNNDEQEHQEQYEVQQIDTVATDSFSIPVNKLRIGGYHQSEILSCDFISLVEDWKTWSHKDKFDGS